ncbi:CCA tRNA nucleotidyltransferase [uncultured Sphingomonas sp.]|uniref:CCA tRNA nucleotidyltransferase n=1 Tax=uncultured Sphingomonas sp. TaxID=158754 RepID=UPI0035CB1678
MDRLILPRAAWRDRPGLARVIAALEPGTTRIVGGAVRDTLIGIDTADIDLATVHDPYRVIDLLDAARIKPVPTGLRHGTITAIANGEVYEVTTLRRDVATDGRHATVAFTDDWREDAARRDFTINALYADPAGGALFDYFGGFDDLMARRVRFIGDPLTRIAEDHLRILRFFRFLARFGDEPDAAGLAACAARANDLMALSRERIAGELLRLLVAPGAAAIVALMLDHAILAPVLPEITRPGRLRRTIDREAASGQAPSATLRLAALLPAGAVDAIGARLKLSNADRKRMAIAVAAPRDDPRTLRYRLGRQGAIDQLLLSDLPDDEVTDRIAAIVDWEPPILPISGGMLVERGLARGPDVARTLHRIEDRWIAEGFPDTARAHAIAADEIAQALAAIRKS